MILALPVFTPDAAGERAKSLRLRGGNNPKVTRRSRASPINDHPQSRRRCGCDMMEREHGAS